MNESLEQTIERLLNFDITALYPVGFQLIKYYDEKECMDDTFKEVLERVMEIAEQFIERGNQTGIPQHVLYMCNLMRGVEAEKSGNKELALEYATLANKYIGEAADLGLTLAYYELGKGFFLGNGIWNKNEEDGLYCLKQAAETPIIPELGIDSEPIMKEIKEAYELCLAQCDNANQSVEEEASIMDNVVAESKISTPKKVKQFSTGYYTAAIAAFIGYILVSILLRNEFGWKSAYDISTTNHWLLGVGATLLLNYSVIPLLLMAYFYQKDNDKHNKFLVSLYIVFLLGCYIDSLLPYIRAGASLSGMNLLNAFLYPTIFLVAHRLLSLLIYAILKRKEGDSDYRIYYGIALFAPFMAWIFIIAIFFWFFQAVANDNMNEYQNSDRKRSLDLKEEVRRELIGGSHTVAVYYDNGWKAVDYWDHGCSLSEFTGDDWTRTYLKDPDGKIYILPTNCPSKESVYYFS